MLNYGRTAECTTCLIEFDKKLLGKTSDNEILSRMEIKDKKDLIEEFKEFIDKDNKEFKDYFD
ncbi:hypothetical protein LCGC14_0908630 [marine sediment metagenome]|uniref:Uncharacterized protein n=1 Tax=marine sediment metagenome TaxID=412755 RepID=A0A0F9RD57_9ZZZZ